jgi:hypothetical protein
VEDEADIAVCDLAEFDRCRNSRWLFLATGG